MLSIYTLLLKDALIQFLLDVLLEVHVLNFVSSFMFVIRWIFIKQLICF